MINFTKFALKRPVTMLLILVTALYFGLQGVLGSPMELTPDINMPMMLIQTTYPGANPEDITETINKPIEDAVGSLSGIQDTYTYAMENASLVMLRYEYGTDMDTAYLDLRKKMDAITGNFPDDADDPVIMEMDMNAMPVMQIMVTSGTDQNLRTYVDNEIKPEFEKVQSVSEVTINGGRDSYIRIELDKAKMDQYHLDMNTVANLIGAADFTIPVGSVDHGDQKLSVSASADYKNVEAIRNIVLTLGNGDVIHLSDIATVYDKLDDQDSISRYNGDDVVTVSISKQQDASAVDVSKDIHKEIATLERSNPTLHFEVINDSADDINDSLRGVFQTLFIAVLLAMLILFLFFGDAKASLIVGTSIPISVMIALCCMSAMGFSMNLISVGSLVLGVGMVVDNSIVVLDSCFRQKKEHKLGFYDGAIEGAHYVIGSIEGSTATTCVVFLPLALLSGMSGQLFKQLGFTIVFCMLASLFSACTIVPLLFYFLHPQEKNEAPVNRAIHAIENAYRKLVRRVLPHNRIAIVSIILLLVFSFGLASRLGFELTPDVDMGQISVTVDLKSGEHLESVDETLKQVEAVIAADPNVEKYLVSYGGTGVGNMGQSSATIYCYLYDKGITKKRHKSTEQIISEWKAPMQKITNASVTMSNASSMGMSSMTNGDIEVDLQGSELDEVKDTTDAIVEALQQEPYVTKVHSSMENAAPVVKIHIDPVKAQAYGLTPAGIAGSMYLAMSGKKVLDFTVDSIDYTARIEYPDDTFADINDIKSWLLTTGSGGQIPLSDVAEAAMEDSPQTLLRRNKRYQVSITANKVEEYKATAEQQMKSFVQNYQKPDGVEMAQNMQDERMGEELGALGNALVTAIFLVFVVMAMQFESVKYSLMVMFTIPFSLIGAFGLMFLAGCKINMISMIGFLMMVGTVVNNGILYVDTANHMRTEQDDFDTALVEAGAVRLRPIFMTSLTTIIAMIPMALKYGTSGQYMQGLALVNVGGLVASTVLSLILLPILYRMTYRKRKGGVDEYEGIID